MEERVSLIVGQSGGENRTTDIEILDPRNPESPGRVHFEDIFVDEEGESDIPSKVMKILCLPLVETTTSLLRNQMFIVADPAENNKLLGCTSIPPNGNSVH